eukprot:TRINITY_DN108314_c0_g1_i1.p1 TRINITY_DN108314_c0_g1~~TRINITY_DN108314_c0_g1_i1.p1  ORF type:complete len:427 (-),score=56.07 TRINITY_DN108314_c0_g1_i1:4-1260(-)
MAFESGSALVDHYAVLGCSPDASASELKRAYHDKIREYHPDKRPDSREGRGQQITFALNQAWELLRDPGKREAYDAAWRREQQASASSEQIADQCRRTGNELYRAATALVQKHGGRFEEPTFGPEELDWIRRASNKFQEAIDTYSRGIEQVPNDYRLWNNRSLCYAAMKQWAKCREDAKRVTLLKPDFMKGWFLLAKSLWKEGSLLEAKNEIDKALSLLPEDAELLALQLEIRGALEDAMPKDADQLPLIRRNRPARSRNVSPTGTPPPSYRMAPPPPIHRPMPPRRPPSRSPTPPQEEATSRLSIAHERQMFRGEAWASSLLPKGSHLHRASSFGDLAASFSKTTTFGDVTAHFGDITGNFGDGTADFGDKVKSWANLSHGKFPGVYSTPKSRPRTLWDMAVLAGVGPHRKVGGDAS